MRKRYQKLIMNICLLTMGIGMLTFPVDFFSGAGKETSSQNHSDDSDNLDSNKNPDTLTPTLAGGSTQSPTSAVQPTAAPTLTPTPAFTPTPLPTPTLTPEENVLIDDVPADILALVNAYFESRLTSIEDYKALIYNADMVDEDLTYKRVEYIVAFHNITCYMQTGTETVDYIVYILNDAEIATISTYAPSLDYILVRYDENGIPKIYLPDENFPAEESEYINALIASEPVQLLVGDVNTRMAAAVQSDSDLMELMKRIQSLTENSSGESSE